ncbi:gephyrin-like molybdotransferase Glp [Flaviflagellibacter deserti]|uniref:Molybdopterin molybdenumtransferase n=1 Tax=Flaviflagellibacter deserti TaxID=2267266 RepID=A0ABV9Z472_9HYPH
MSRQPLLPVAEALAHVLRGATLLGTEAVPLTMAAGRTLAEPITALRTQPSFPSSAMDGYAVRTADAVEGAELRLIGESAAGHLFSGRLEAGQTVRIFTGGAVPENADAVVAQEDTVREGDRVSIIINAKPNQHIRPAGLDFRADDVLLEAGTLLTARSVALVAATGRSEIVVARRPRVAILATGDELVEPGEEPRDGQINGSNGIMLENMVRTAGGEPIELGIARDTLEAIQDAARHARDLNADVIVTTGGASVGDHDLVHKALSAEGLKLDFWRVALRPGRPMMAGNMNGIRMLGLPGNPVSTHVCAFLFMVPLLRALQGRRDVHHQLEYAVLGTSLGENQGRQDYMRGKLTLSETGVATAMPFGRQDSSMLRLLAEADCLIMRPPEDAPRSKGDPCRIIRLDEHL